jgi:hypothetical protein
LQLGFKKGIGCGPAIYGVQNVVKYFTNHCSYVNIAALDASKAFDRLNHNILFDTLKRKKLPSFLINTLVCWYSKLVSLIKWNDAFSANFEVLCGVRQGGILSPLLFNMYVDGLLHDLSNCGYGCYIKNIFYGCFMYADDIILLSPSFLGLQHMLDRCYLFGRQHDIIFNAKKSLCAFIGSNKSRLSLPSLLLGDQKLMWSNDFKYLGVHFRARHDLEVNTHPIKCNFYASLNSILSKC